VGTIRTTVNSTALFTDLARTVTEVLTFSVPPVFSSAQTFADAVTVTTGGLTITAGGLTVTAGASTFGADVTVTGVVTATTFAGSGASLTALPAAQLTGTLPALDGAALTNLNASALASGNVPEARLPTTYTTLTVTSGIANNTYSAQTAYSSGGTTAQLRLSSSGVEQLLLIGSTADFVSDTAPAGATDKYLNIRVGVNDYRIALTRVS